MEKCDKNPPEIKTNVVGCENQKKASLTRGQRPWLAVKINHQGPDDPVLPAWPGD